jgi:glycosyltransferase involved in cell wall biosynthesis
MKKISVIVNCHNGEKYLSKCISSILNQIYQNYEIIFFDNFSSDNSKKILKSFKDERIKYFYSDTKFPLYKARNEAIKKSTGSLIAFLDVDDWWENNFLSSKEKFFEDSKYDYFYSNTLMYHEKSNKFIKYKNFSLPDGRIYEFLAKDYFIIISGLIIKKEILEKEKYFNENYNIIGDYDLMMRVSKYTNAKGFDQPLINYRVHEKNFSKINNKMYFEEYKDWFNKQNQKNDINFNYNKSYFLLKLEKLEIIYFLYSNKSLKLFLKIIKFPNFLIRIKFLLAFFLPLSLINYLRK